MFDEVYLETNDECVGYWIFDDKQSDVDSILNNVGDNDSDI
jgi:hypothetical protein